MGQSLQIFCLWKYGAHRFLVGVHKMELRVILALGHMHQDEASILQAPTELIAGLFAFASKGTQVSGCQMFRDISKLVNAVIYQAPCQLQTVHSALLLQASLWAS